MKKFATTLVLAFFAITAIAQKVEVKKDDFTGEKVITTDYLKIYQGGATAKNQTRVRFRHENGEDYIEYRIFTDAVVSCKKGSKVLVKTDNGIVETENTDYAIAEPGAWSVKPVNSNLGIYIVCSCHVQNLQGKMVEKIRFNLSDGHIDIDIKEKESDKLQKLLNDFIEAVK